MPGKESKGETSSEIKLKPVGVVRSEIKELSLVAGSRDLKWRGKLEASKAEKSGVSELVLNSDLTDMLDGIEEFSHLLVLYWPHLVPPESRVPMKVHPMGRGAFPMVGLFATCSPIRPNSILVMAVRLLERKGNILRVEGLDAVDGSPVLDIKPYVPSYYAKDEVRESDWMKQIHREFANLSS
ncbi:MAG: tRNA (N6-threonylcarbamoyladenosine(37)-N6)-methyltransferase TrmO [Dehalococcoidia bacterium]|nr:tRNA (N6-threonylcarbamoyladenosine(37)-N6)-methyltransferase TrmO [Dehalococcoidia bacterium]